MMEWLDALLQRPVVAHLVRATTRFSTRNGPLFAAAVTYYSVLSLVPIMMFALAIVGLVLTAFLSDWLREVKLGLLAQLSDGALGEKLSPMIDAVFNNLASTSLIALALALWTGTGWIGSLRRAVQAQLRNDDDAPLTQRGPIAEILVNMGTFMLFIVLTLATLVVTTLSTTFNKQLLGWLGFADTTLGSIILGVVAVLLTACAGTVLFLYLYRVLPDQSIPRREWLIGSLGAGIGLAALQSLAGVVTGALSKNLSASIFGPVIVLMLFFNFYATLIMFTAAWIGTADEPTPVVEEVVVEAEPARLGPWPARATGELFSEENPDAYPVPDPNVYLPQDVAAKGVRVGATVGYGLGAATGIGLGALLAAVAKGMFRRK